MAKAEELLAEIEKNGTERTRIHHSEYKGRELVDIRVFYADEAGKYLPSKRGISLSRERFGELLAAMNEAAEKLPAAPSES